MGSKHGAAKRKRESQRTVEIKQVPEKQKSQVQADAEPVNKFLRSWAWKRERLPDKLRFHRPYTYSFDPRLDEVELKDVVIHQEKFDAEGFASTVWDSSIVMCKYFEMHPSEVCGKRVCDLSAGTGLVGIVASRLGANVNATDLEPNLKLLQRNISVNEVDVQIASHLWGTSVHKLDPPFDVIVACDVMYVAEAVVDLEKSLRALSSPNSTVYIAHGRNCTAEDEFIKLCKLHWTCDIVPDDKLHEVYQAEDVTVWRLRLRQR